ncbi:MAG: hypothetical protein A2X61_09330 [Ignavibacteria bacterium GWB2_35_12]|nr:MAG: hypothetical protein A2X63_03940 [Ignavibacteria bacterium GWA2_35_8]OGU38180.1 MAG: hypothetical protein A2X61_09330 [Ignavibacteria bacterium GWB2_35_12]OGU93936.1 MAG: hypothetical protein A2220_03955 [Ignavibacteria bacterium RIFOXYA2_FULL_35_10]OGV20037.1 MAG: hypothetical protein A2475_03055 [Ignavibacteria bacterium RIFOXYC2_FULL_35_21]
MKLLSLTLVAIIVLILSISTADARTRYVLGSGGVEELPDGSICYCPIPSEQLCAVIEDNTSGHIQYPHVLTYYEGGSPVGTYNVNDAGYNENGQPTWWVEP